MKKFFSILILLPFGFLYPQSNAVLSEIMFYPQSADDEFIEIFNTSKNESIDLTGFKIIYQNSKADTLKSTGSGMILKPESFAVIFEGDYDFANGIYKNLIPPDALILKINDNSFGSRGMSNSSERSIQLLTSDDDTIQTYIYSADNSEGFSDEKILLNDDNSAINWSNSLQLNGTPGFDNSVSPLSFDLEIESFSFSPEILIEDSSITLNVKIKNNGISKAGNYQINIYNDLNFDSIGNAAELIFSKNFSGLNVNDSNEVQIILASLKAGSYNFISEIQFNDDENIFNNTKFLQIKVFPPANSFNDIVINEIMYAPKSGEPEWLEFVNKSSKKINLNGWRISDAVNQTILTNSDFFLEPDSFLVLSKDSTILNFYTIPGKIIFANFPSLNNSGDKIVIKDSLGIIIDSLNYLPEWGGSDGKSLERISILISSNQKENWKTSHDKNNATPGKINSVTKKDFDIELSEIIFTPEFPLIGENVSVSVKIKNDGKNPSDFFIKLFEDTNLDSIPDNLLFTSEKINLESNDSATVPLNYLINNLQNEKGFYAYTEFDEDQDTSNNYFYKKISPGFQPKVVLINEIMYDPLSNEPEWIELVNNSDKKLNLKGWKISGAQPDTSKKIISEENFSIEPNEFFIITKDSSFFKFYSEVKSKVLTINFGSLGNSSDGIIIYDFRNSVIDSLKYNSNWGGQNGFSLERISLTNPTNDSTNWLSSIDVKKSTPGKENSVINISSFKRNDLVINEIMFDPDKDNSEFVEFLNISNKPVNIAGWKIQDDDENYFTLSETNFLIPQNSFFVLAADSLILSKYNLKDSTINILNNGSLSLSNSGKLILLKDLLGNTIDSVFYTEKWHNKNFTETKNISLERINPYLNANDPLNWSSSASQAGATPGKQNSIYTLNRNLSKSLTISPNPFSPDNDGFEDFAIINFKLSQPTSQIRVKIFDSKGRFLRTLSNNAASGSKGSIIFDGLDDYGNPLRMGIYIIFLEALNSNSGVVETLKKAFVIARKL